MKQESDAVFRKLFSLLFEFVFQFFDDRQIGILQVSKCDYFPATGTELRKRFHVFVDRTPNAPRRVVQYLSDFLGNERGLFQRVLPNPPDLFKLIDGGVGRVTNFSNGFSKFKCALVIDPEIGIQYVICFLDQVHIDFRIGFFAVDQIDDFVAFRHAAYHIPITDLVQIGIGFVASRGFRFGERSLPNLNGVMFLRGAFPLEINHVAVGEDGIPIAVNGRFDPLLNHVVRQQHVRA